MTQPNHAWLANVTNDGQSLKPPLVGPSVQPIPTAVETIAQGPAPAQQAPLMQQTLSAGQTKGKIISQMQLGRR